ncbi:MAG: UDP-2,3-diacylglucosamine diphosphatase [Nitrospirota bacterium]|nr:UDP-2,3-diacylglucosamine diphosphatase [Nitrospirota bacterium]
MKTLRSSASSFYFVADIHLSPHRPETTARFLSLLNTVEKSRGELFLLGDIFDYWANNGAVRRANAPVLERLGRLVDAGCPVHFIIGNRDFLMEEKVLGRYGINFLGEEATLIVGDRKILLSHGHLLATNDTVFLDYRARMWPMFRFLDLFLPGPIENRLAGHFMQKSKEVIGEQDAERFRIPDETIHRYFQDGFDVIICGHTHKPQQRDFEGGKALVVLPPWEKGGGGYAIMEEGPISPPGGSLGFRGPISRHLKLMDTASP